MLCDKINFGLGVSDELIDRYNHGDTVVVADINNVAIEVRKPCLQRNQIFLREAFTRHTTVKFQCPNSGDEHSGRGTYARRAALNIDKLLST